MTCKIDHNDPESIPKILCRTCTPVPSQKAVEPVEIKSGLNPEQALAYKRKHRRRLRAECRELSDELDKMRIAHQTHRVAKAEVDRAERKWQSAYTELAALGADIEDALEEDAA